ncbi:hypothetical protein BDB00DRAFT_845673 [Zychaea mexicana]|uniref:uncharacterized protein n=1 Tax=Zychaea mexicana TaxID=64656 RepID=UPI0022FE363D|nr:uncharacterized protein BDB00DRAFT_845673 [Zychaea mexicana]KAI9488997.1 hypothetical protein BDB00DRAFT_845673 [Zychaea mexicana]
MYSGAFLVIISSTNIYRKRCRLYHKYKRVCCCRRETNASNSDCLCCWARPRRGQGHSNFQYSVLINYWQPLASRISDMSVEEDGFHSKLVLGCAAHEDLPVGAHPPSPRPSRGSSCSFSLSIFYITQSASDKRRRETDTPSLNAILKINSRLEMVFWGVRSPNRLSLLQRKCRMQ